MDNNLPPGVDFTLRNQQNAALGEMAKMSNELNESLKQRLIIVESESKFAKKQAIISTVISSIAMIATVISVTMQVLAH